MPKSVEVRGDLVQKLREERYLERREVAEMAGITPHRLYVIERIDRRTKPATLRRIALALNVHPRELEGDGRIPAVNGGAPARGRRLRGTSRISGV